MVPLPHNSNIHPGQLQLAFNSLLHLSPDKKDFHSHSVAKDWETGAGLTVRDTREHWLSTP